MTTVAWCGGMLAADGQSTFGHKKKTAIRKLNIIAGDIVACAGKIVNITQFHEWYANGTDFSNKPDLGEEPELDALILKPDGRCYRIEDDFVQYEVNPPFAIGSGWTEAEAAMYLGKNALDAVRFAATRCVYTGAPFSYASFKKDRRGNMVPSEIKTVQS